jgi:hypothetical protein
VAQDEKVIRHFTASLQQMMRDTNQAVIDPMLPDLTLAALADLVEAGARVRGAYLKTYFELAGKTGDHLPTPEDVKTLRGMRELYEEMSAAYQALETAIGRGYLTTR